MSEEGVICSHANVCMTEDCEHSSLHLHDSCESICSGWWCGDMGLAVEC